MSTPISGFREMVRVLIDDNDSDIQMRENAQIDAALRGVLDSGFVDGYAVDGTRLLVTPDLLPADDPDSFVRLTYRAATLFTPGLSEGWRTRAFSHVSSYGATADRIMLILQGLFEANSGLLAAASNYE